MRKKLAILLMITAILTLVSCGGGTSGGNGSQEPAGPWFERRGVEITPQGEVSFNTSNYDDSAEHEIKATVTVTEEPLADFPGYKAVRFTAYCDIAAISDGWWIWASAFDRESGISFEFVNDGHSLDAQPEAEEGGEEPVYSAFENGAILPDGTDISVNRLGEIYGNRETYGRYITVVCPEDYNGAVFQLGYASAALDEKNKAIDYAAAFRSVDDTPYFDNGHDYLYFTVSGE